MSWSNEPPTLPDGVEQRQVLGFSGRTGRAFVIEVSRFGDGYRYRGPHGDRSWPSEWWWAPIEPPVQGAVQQVAALGLTGRERYDLANQWGRGDRSGAVDVLVTRDPSMSREFARDLLKRLAR